MKENITTIEQFIAGIRAMCCTRERAEVEFLRAQVRTLRGVIGNKRILLSDEQRRLLATTGFAAKEDKMQGIPRWTAQSLLRRQGRVANTCRRHRHIVNSRGLSTLAKKH